MPVGGAVSADGGALWQAVRTTAQAIAGPARKIATMACLPPGMSAEAGASADLLGEVAGEPVPGQVRHLL